MTITTIHKSLLCHVVCAPCALVGPRPPHNSHASRTGHSSTVTPRASPLRAHSDPLHLPFIHARTLCPRPLLPTPTPLLPAVDPDSISLVRSRPHPPPNLKPDKMVPLPPLDTARKLCPHSPLTTHPDPHHPSQLHRCRPRSRSPPPPLAASSPLEPPAPSPPPAHPRPT